MAETQNTLTDEILVLAETLGDIKARFERVETEFATQAKPLEAALSALSAAMTGIKTLQHHVLDNSLSALSIKVEEQRKAIDDQIGVIVGELKGADAANSERISAQTAELRQQLAEISGSVRELASQFDAQLKRVELEAKEEAKKFALVPGPQGPAGASINPRGNWIDGVAYNRLDVVSLLGTSYISAVDNNTSKPAKASDKWTILARAGTGGGGAGDFGSLAGVAQINQGGTGQTTAIAGARALLDGISTTQGSVLYRGASGWTSLPPGSSGFVLQSQGAGADPIFTAVSGSGLGDVSGPASATDNAIVRFDGTSGKNVQNSAVTIDDSGNLTVSGTGTSTFGGPVKSSGYTLATGTLSAFNAASGGVYIYYSGGGLIGSYSDNSGTFSALTLDASTLTVRPNGGSPVFVVTPSGATVVGAASVSGNLTVSGTGVTVGSNAGSNSILTLNSSSGTTQGIIFQRGGVEAGRITFPGSATMTLDSPTIATTGRINTTGDVTIPAGALFQTPNFGLYQTGGVFFIRDLVNSAMALRIDPGATPATTVLGNLTVSGTGTHTFSGPLGVKDGSTTRISAGNDGVLFWGSDIASGTSRGRLTWDTGKAIVQSFGNLDLTAAGGGGVQINSTSAVKGIRTATATYDFGTIAAGSTQSTSVSVSGAATGDSVTVNTTDSLYWSNAGLIFAEAAVGGANTVSVRLSNPTGSPIAVGSRTFRVTVISF